MSSDPSTPSWMIRARDLSKTYRLYDKPHHRLLQSVWGDRRQYYRDFAAIQNVSFELDRGQTLGIIGRNGAGKSTLLQIICGTLTPSAGDVEVRGRIAALLELGTGFNPDFTGRENLFINAAILGLTPSEIEARTEDIIAFADIGRFIDQPVKTYSSGMYVRLAFAVVVHVDPDILIVDEALAVGDAFFQAKCMTRMHRMLDDGLTLLFISHDISAVKALCSRTLWLERGKVRGFGATADITRDYGHDWVRQANATQSTAVFAPTPDAEISEEGVLSTVGPDISMRNGTGEARLTNIKWSVDNLPTTETVAHFGDTLSIKALLVVYRPCARLTIAFHIKNAQNQHVLGGHTADEPQLRERNWQPGERADITFRVPVRIHAGAYSLTMLVSTMGDVHQYTDAVFLDWVEDATVMKVMPRERYPLTDMVELTPDVLVLRR